MSDIPLQALSSPVKHLSKDPSSPVNQFPEDPSSPVNKFPETPVGPVNQCAEDPGLPGNHISETSSSPVNQFPEDLSLPVNHLSVLPVSPISQFAKAPLSPVNRLLETPPSPMKGSTELLTIRVNRFVEADTFPVDQIAETPISPVNECVEASSLQVNHCVQASLLPVKECVEDPLLLVNERVETSTFPQNEFVEETMLELVEEDLVPEISEAEVITDKNNTEKTTFPISELCTDILGAPPVKKRGRKKKQFTDMISSANAVSGLQVLRPHIRSSTVFKDKNGDENTQGKISDASVIIKSRKRRVTDLAKEVDVEALIAISVGFPVDSLTEEEIEAGVVLEIGGTEQANYCVVRNHILARWRSNVSVWMTRDQVLESIRVEHKELVDMAYNFLLEHGYINFGLAPAMKEAKFRHVNGVEKANVVVVGAGLAGLVAARQLITLGFKVVIVEGRSRPGGRVRTKKMKGGNVEAAADIGGSVLTGINGNPLGVLARQLQLPLHKVRDICPLYLPDGKEINSDIDSSVEAAFNKLLDKVCNLREVMTEELKSVDVSLGAALEAFRSVYKVADDPLERMLLNWHLANLEYANASLMSDLSVVYWDQDDPFEMGGDHCFIPGGNERFIRALAEDLTIFYDQTVKSIQYGTYGVVAYTGGQEFRGDMLLCTVPLGVLKKGSIEFVPELPQRKKEVIQRLGFGLLNKVAMLFPHEFWGGEIDTFGHLTKDSSMRGEFFLFYSYASVSGGPLLVALVAGEAAVQFEKMSPLESVNRVLNILRVIFHPKGIEVPNPVQVVCTRWGNDQFSYGSYSYVSIGSSGDDYDILAENIGNGRVFFAGEATNKQYPATMHGAFLSGMREAANIFRVANKRSTIPSDESNNNMKDEKEDLKDLYSSPDLKFGNFSVLFDPNSSDDQSNTLMRVEFKSGDSGVGGLYLFGLIQRKQVIELSEVDGDENRMKMLNCDHGVKLVGRACLCSAGESLIATIKSARHGDR